MRVPLVSLKNERWFLAKMWKNISGVPKVIKEEQKDKNPKAACDSKEHEKNSARKFLVKWQVGRRGYRMITIREWFASGALETNKLWWHRMCWTQPGLSKAVLATKQSQFRITRRAHRIFWHCNAIELTYIPQKTPANLARQRMHKQYTGKLRLLFRNTHAVAKTKKPIADYDESEAEMIEELVLKVEKELLWNKNN